MSEVYAQLARWYASEGNVEGLRFIRRSWAAVDPTGERSARRSLNELVRASIPARLERELRWAALEGLPGAFAASIAQHPSPSRFADLEDLCYTHALFRWYADRCSGRVTLDLHVPVPVQKTLLLSRLGFTREDEVKLDRYASCIASDWGESLDRLDPFELSFDTYRSRDYFDPRLCYPM